MADTDTDEQTPSQEMVQRITTERDAARAAAEAALRVDKAYEHFKGVEGISDPYGLAKLAVPSVAEWGDDYTAKLDSWYDTQKKFFGAPPAQAPEAKPEGNEAASPPTPSAIPPGMAPSAPSPAANGGQPGIDPLTWNSPEIQQLRQKGDVAGIQKLVREGRYKPHPNNTYAGQAPQG